MARTSVEVPSALAGTVRDTVLLLYHSTVEALHLALRSHVGDGEPHGEVHASRTRLAELDSLLDQLGWWDDPPRDPASGNLDLAGPRDILHDALFGALIDAGERLAAACGEGWPDGAGPDRVRAAALEVIALDAVLAEVRD